MFGWGQRQDSFYLRGPGGRRADELFCPTASRRISKLGNTLSQYEWAQSIGARIDGLASVQRRKKPACDLAFAYSSGLPGQTWGMNRRW